ncbi:MAG: peptidylprolyl isomerase [Deltaproteobacteria bacterium]|nr:peptidylprolyl isomerase [Deltaproteobacteria bacterium]
MKTKISRSWPVIFLFVFILLAGCSGKKDSNSAAGANNVQGSVSGLPSSESMTNVNTGDMVVSVDGKVLKKSELENNLNERFNLVKNKIPSDKQKEFKENLRNQLINVFIMKTLLSNEIDKRKIEVSNQEVKMAMDGIQASLPPNKKIDDFFKENKITQNDIIFAVKVEKFRNMEIGQKAKPTQKEISKFYNDNKEKLFSVPESVHVRHILVAVGKEDSDKIKAEKKEKIESIRKQLLSGGDFADVARKNSDCPSKEVGGDLNYIKKGQMVKPFETAAFSQEKNVIGPVVKTEYGYHIIQVLDRKPAKKITLEEAKGKISAYLEQRKKVEAFNAILKDLQSKAKIVVYKN